MNEFTLEDLRELNVFYLDHDPDEAAQAHCDRHVVKMIVETAQLLSSAWHVVAPTLVESDIGNTDPAFPLGEFAQQRAANLTFGQSFYLGNQRIYAPTHLHHPCAEWVRESSGNYDWAWRLGMALLEEYSFRYGRTHATTSILRTLELVPPGVPEAPLVEPPLAMADEFQVIDSDGYGDALASYRRYYRDGKRHLLMYTRRAPPEWLADVAAHKPARYNGPAHGEASSPQLT